MGVVDRGFRGLAELLGAALTRGAQGPDELRAVGLGWGRLMLVELHGQDARTALPVGLERLGFQAQVTETRINLWGCPCPLVARERPHLVCHLMRAVIDGILSESPQSVHVSDSLHDPAQRRCDVVLRSGASPPDRPPAIHFKKLEGGD